MRSNDRLSLVCEVTSFYPGQSRATNMHQSDYNTVMTSLSVVGSNSAVYTLLAVNL